MKWPPMVLYMKIRNERHGFWLWLPLFIIGPLFTLFLIALFLIVLPFVLVALLIALLAVVFEWQTEWLRVVRKQMRWMWYAIKGVPAFFGVLCSLKGTRIDVNSKNSRVLISIY